MKKIVLLILIALFAVNITAAPKKPAKKDSPKTEAKTTTETKVPESKPTKLDLSKKPDALQEVDFKFPEYKIDKLKNGIKVFIVEDHEQPDVTIEFMIGAGSANDGEKVGAAEFTASILTKGTKTLKALNISKTLDGIGAGFGLGAGREYTTAYGGLLKKHINKFLDIAADVMMNPSFPQDEFEKLTANKITELQYQKSQPNTLCGNLMRQVIYGVSHPYAQIVKEENINKLTIEDLKDYYSKWYIPNNLTIAVIGDFNKKEIMGLLEAKFGSWKNGEKPVVNIPEPKPMPKGVYFINRPGSVQSTLIFAAPAMAYTNRDYEVLDVVKTIMSVGSTSHLYKTLREKYSFTYGPHGAISQNKIANHFLATADVATAKTDSSIMITLNEFNNIGIEPISAEELNRTKLAMIGNYYMSFENSNTIANIIQFDDFMGKPLNLMKDYTTRLKVVSAMDIAVVAKRYITPEQTYIVVVGDPSIKADLEKYGKVYDYDTDLIPSSGLAAKYDKVSMTAEELLTKYTNALGGKKALADVTTMISNGEAELKANGQTIPGKVNSTYKVGNKMFQSSDFGIFKQEQWINGKEVWSSTPTEPVKVGGEEANKAMLSAVMFADTKLIELGYQCEVLGKKDGFIVMKATDPNKDIISYYYDENTYLLAKKESITVGPQGSEAITEFMEDYIDVNNIKLPSISRTVMPQLTWKIKMTYKLNVDINDSEFTPVPKK